jgi:hypothetical protein
MIKDIRKGTRLRVLDSGHLRCRAAYGPKGALDFRGASLKEQPYGL